MRVFSLINFQWNNTNGWVFDILEIEIKSFEGSFFMINFCKRFMYVNLLWFIKFRIYEQNN